MSRDESFEERMSGEALEVQVDRARAKVEWAYQVLQNAVDVNPGFDPGDWTEQEVVKWAESEPPYDTEIL